MRKILSNLGFFIVFLLVCETAAARDLVGQRVELKGRWEGGVFKATSAQRADPKDPQRGRVVGRIDSVDTYARRLQIGPILVEWHEDTRLEEGISLGDLIPSRPVKIKGKLLGPSHLRATSVRPTGPVGAQYLQLRGTVTEAERRADGSMRLTVLGVPVEVSTGKVVNTRIAKLIRRPDDRRPETQLTLPFFGRPLTIGGELSTKSAYKGNFKLKDRADDDVFSLEQKLEFEFFYSLSERVLLFFEAKARYEADLFTEDEKREVTRALERGETWLYVSNLWDSPVSLQVGRQNFRDKREWWWDMNLDAFRLHYDRPLVHAELAIAYEAVPFATDANGIAPKQDDVLRLLGHTAWSWAEDQRLDAFFLYNHDHSRRHSIGQLVREEREDPRDAKLVWLGTQASGEWDLDAWGEVDYLIQGAWVGGTEHVFDFDENEEDHNSVVFHDKRSVSGWAFDSFLTWETPLPWEPRFTLGYAFGSGDRNPDRGTDHSFHQTELHDNNGRFRGVDRFRYYGELLRPDLSNLHIWTASLGVPLLQNSSVEFVYHFYQQVYPVPFFQASRLKARPLGRRRTIGQEWDIVLGLEEWEHVEVELIGALFRAGSAFGRLSGETAYGLFFKIDYNF